MYGRNDLTGVLQTRANRHLFTSLSLMNAFLDRVQSQNSVGTKSEIRGSNEGPKLAERAVIRSIADDEELLCSEYIAQFSWLEMERIYASISSGQLRPSILKYSVNSAIACLIVSHVPCEIGRDILMRISSRFARADEE